MDNFLFQSHQHQQQLLLQSNLMNPFSLSSKFTPKPKTLFSTSSPSFRYFWCTSSQNSIEVIQAINRKSNTSTNATTTSKAKIQNLKENWLSSLSMNDINNNNTKEENGGLQWVIGVDPDVSGALSLLKYDNSGCISAQVFDSPYVQVSIGKTRRKRLDAKSIVQLLQSFDAPLGTAAYLEQSIPFPQDGKLGWWSGGFGYGLWIGALVASGFSVVPVPSRSWKMEFELARSSSTKDDSRELAACLFPDLSSMLKRKKDHGRAEALLIAAYGKGHMTKADEARELDDAREALSQL